MVFEEFNKSQGGAKTRNNYISVNRSNIIFGSNMEADFKEGDYAAIFIDYDNKKIAFRKTYDVRKGYKISRDHRKENVSIHISPKMLCNIIPRKKYRITKEDDLWIFSVTEIARESK